MESVIDVVRAAARARFGASTDIFEIAPLSGDASSRRYYRAHMTGPAPTSIIVMEMPHGSTLPLSSEELAVFKAPPKELPFINVHRFLTRVGVRVPALYGDAADSRILLLEDLGDVALWDRVQGLREAEILRWYENALDQLVLLQVGGTRQRDDACIAFQQRFDYRLYMWEFEHFIEYGLTRRPELRVGADAVDAMRAIFSAIAHRLDARPACLNHRDYHSWNLMIHRNEVAVIDFQDALLAPPQYDLASLLNDRITDDVIQPSIERRLIDSFLDRRRQAGAPAEDRDEFLEIYLLSSIQRDLKVVGRFHYLDRVKGKAGYTKFIGPTARRIKRHLEALPDMRELLSLLAENLPELQ